MKLDSVDEGVVVNRPCVGGSSSQCLPISLTGCRHILVGHGRERQNLE